MIRFIGYTGNIKNIYTTVDAEAAILAASMAMDFLEGGKWRFK
jgi:hypothetical protein